MLHQTGETFTKKEPGRQRAIHTPYVLLCIRRCTSIWFPFPVGRGLANTFMAWETTKRGQSRSFASSFPALTEETQPRGLTPASCPVPYPTACSAEDHAVRTHQTPPAETSQRFPCPSKLLNVTRKGKPFSCFCCTLL